MATSTYDYLRYVSRSNDVSTQKAYEIRQLKRQILLDFQKSIDAETVTINGTSRIVLITRDKADEQIKKIKSRPDETINLGDDVVWNNTHYIVYKMDADRRIQSKGRMYECNSKLRWKNTSGTIVERYGKAEDATKYSEGTQGGNVLREGEFQTKIMVRLDSETALIQRDDRFMFKEGNYTSQMIAAGIMPKVMRVTRINYITGTFSDVGYVEVTLVEDNYVAGYDDVENGIAAKRKDIVNDSTINVVTNNVPADGGGWL